jgi:hypothetical protein
MTAGGLPIGPPCECAENVEEQRASEKSKRKRDDRGVNRVTFDARSAAHEVTSSARSASTVGLDASGVPCDMLSLVMPRVFLLSPAYCGGRRATMLLNPASQMPLAQQLAVGTLTLGDAFSFMSGLYFRGKLAYASHFGKAILVITPTRGLQAPDTVVSRELLLEFAGVDVHTDDRRYRRPLDRDVKRLAAENGQETVVLLGSIATGKYVDALTRAFGPRLHYPTSFVGRGDMSRGGLLLRSVASNEELEYSPMVPGAARHGARPPKLPPLKPPSRPRL